MPDSFIVDAEFSTHVLIAGTFDNRPLPIIHTTGGKQGNERVWVQVSYADDLPAEALPVGDTVTNGYDPSGNRIVSVPASLCTFLTDEEAESIEQAAYADAKLLQYAGG